MVSSFQDATSLPFRKPFIPLMLLKLSQYVIFSPLKKMQTLILRDTEARSYILEPDPSAQKQAQEEAGCRRWKRELYNQLVLKGCPHPAKHMDLSSSADAQEEGFRRSAALHLFSSHEHNQLAFDSLGQSLGFGLILEKTTVTHQSSPPREGNLASQRRLI